MELFKVSRFRYRNVFGLPTWRGLLLSAVLGAALWFSIFNNSEIERWLFLLMILLLLVHLTESGRPFRFMQLKILPFDPPYLGELIKIPVQISNPTELNLDFLYVKFNDEKNWVEVAPLAPHSSTLVFLPLQFQDLSLGQIGLPRIKVKTYPAPRLFRFWRIVDCDETTFVLPRPINHQVPARTALQKNHDDELFDIEQIRDARFLPLMDQKLFLKTGQPYRRVHKSKGSSEVVRLNWAALENLSQAKKGEQFSFWIQSISEAPAASMDIEVNTPFMIGSYAVRSFGWRSLKILFAQWFYAQK